MAMISNGKPLIVNGTGTAYLQTVVNGMATSIPLGTLQSMNLAFKGAVEKVYGGDGLAAIYVFDKSMDITCSFEEARFSLDYLQFATGASMNNNGQLILPIAPTLIASGTSFTIPGGLTSIIPTSVIVSLSSDPNGLSNVTPLTYTAGTPGAGQFSVTSAGLVTLGTAVTNQYISGVALYSDNVSRTANITTASLPGYVSIYHRSKPINMGDGANVILNTVIYKAKADGQLQVDQKRAAASATKLGFEIFYDTTRADNSIMTISQQLC
jgi:hypothetical protein